MAQGTIKDFDVEARTGSLLMEDRTEVHIDPTSLEGSGLRYLRHHLTGAGRVGRARRAVSANEPSSWTRGGAWTPPCL
jgi:hypothetical protein